MPITLPNGSAVPTAEEMMSAVSAPLPGNVSLRDWFQEKRGRRAGLAHLLNVSVATVSGWGRAKMPSYPHEPAHLFAIEQLCGIPLAAWIQPTELEALAPVVENWKDHVFVPTSRRAKADPRQMHMDELLARQSVNLTTTEKLDAQSLSASEPETDDDVPLDIDSMMEGAS